MDVLLFPGFGCYTSSCRAQPCPCPYVDMGLHLPGACVQEWTGWATQGHFIALSSAIWSVPYLLITLEARAFIYFPLKINFIYLSDRETEIFTLQMAVLAKAGPG